MTVRRDDILGQEINKCRQSFLGQLGSHISLCLSLSLSLSLSPDMTDDLPNASLEVGARECGGWAEDDDNEERAVRFPEAAEEDDGPCDWRAIDMMDRMSSH